MLEEWGLNVWRIVILLQVLASGLLTYLCIRNQEDTEHELRLLRREMQEHKDLVAKLGDT